MAKNKIASLDATAMIRTVSESFIERYRPESQSTDWGQSLAIYGLLRGLTVDDNPKVRAYLRRWISFHLSERLWVHYFCGSWSFALLYPEVVREFPEFRMQLDETALRVYEFIHDKALRNGEGFLLHNIDLPHIYIDTVYYSSALLARIGPYLNAPWEDEAVKQLVLHLERLQDGNKPFFIHCEENHGGKRSEGSWARGNGWVMMTLAEMLPLLDKKSTRYKSLAAIFEHLGTELAQRHTKRGLWRTILDDKMSYEEASASAMYLFAYLRAQRLGMKWVSAKVVQNGILGLMSVVDRDGRVLEVSEGTWPGTIEYYKSLSTGEWWWGTGAFLLAMTERAQQ